MSIPTYTHFIEPILRFLAKHPEGIAVSAVYEAAADALKISPEERTELLPSGGQAVYKNRAGWAHDRLKRAGLSSSPRARVWQLTPKGLEYAKKNVSPLSANALASLVEDYKDVRLRQTQLESPQVLSQPQTELSPDDRLSAALAELRASVAAELLEILLTVSPTFFERIVLDVLHNMGYGEHRNDIQRVGGTGDGGIDGIISLDKLGLEKVYIQAKRWQQSVGRPDIQAFYGALAGQKAKKGVFITTSVFTPPAIDFVKSVEGIVLVDGQRLANLMIDHEVGVSLRTLHVPKLDSDYFDE